MDDINKKVEQLIEKLAKKHFNVETMETRNLDRLDFYDVAIWSIKKALEEAIEEGMAIERKQGAYLNLWEGDYEFF